MIISLKKPENDKPVTGMARQKNGEAQLYARPSISETTWITREP
jgi:hypothetical protein